MAIRIFQVDAFTDRLFSGNPAAVCPLQQWLADDLLQQIAMENNLAETAFYVTDGADYRIRWFTPTVEVDLCGHATLAAAHVLFEHESYAGDEVKFKSRSGMLRVTRKDDILTLDFPADALRDVALEEEMLKAFNFRPSKVFRGKSDYMFVFDEEAQVENLKPDLAVISTWKVRGVIVTARGTSSDFVSRFFAPQSGINEDPVTGSAHTTLTPYWAKVFNKTSLTAIQLSPRKGYLKCDLKGDRVTISGQARTFMKGIIQL